MEKSFRPKISCRFKIRQDIESWIGFFDTRGVLTFNEAGAFIANQMKGDKDIREIGEVVKDKFPSMEDPMNEVISVAKQLEVAGLLE
ncbi:hypothetical protein CO083_05100 [Candidatus Roizmanbacteria bacterium CG_4_9_14_0_8_um_filter_34_12]|uniref:PqqD family protein n=1 Tax=Candidatus Roizmanbacteria bacterium CG_4_9_14_0_8_um_filter_34_12 TaxID=1974840 RepID=A0A2M8DBM9_9BACT|nr:MAG: hypothetical protein COX45_02410 [Candidatus Portnoybacteria bacterium CG23_combo_of_CG06-09_8_20_14_all_44_36]PJB87801.1 MAG: hypothetical protein CO083_05100 [Candidatus Roizmanbacteria bacterium CG_4_9_14_0_8_um_filter_34_12]